jgi:hypothetical protein
VVRQVTGFWWLSERNGAASKPAKRTRQQLKQPEQFWLFGLGLKNKRVSWIDQQERLLSLEDSLVSRIQKAV